MGDLVRYNTQALAREQCEEIQSIVEATQAVQQEISRIRTEGARMAVETLTHTRERIHTAARNGMSEQDLARLIDDEKQYLVIMRYIAMQGTGELHSVLRGLPTLPGE